MNITFLTSGHIPFDDRIFHHFGRSLADHNHKVEIISSKQKLTGIADGIKMNCFEGDLMPKTEKISMFRNMLEAAKPEIVICSEPLTLIAAKRYSGKQKNKVRIIYDITEWYPSGKNLSVYKVPFRLYFFIKLCLFNLWTAGMADSFIFGEYYKSKPYRYLLPFKPFIFVPYYPDLKYIPVNIPNLIKGRLKLSYSGRISLEKGFGNFISVLQKLSAKEPSLNIEVVVVGWYETLSDKTACEPLLTQLNKNIVIQIYERQDFKNFIDLIKDCDIFLDLRVINLENNYCLPIKMFYYAALGRPVIYSGLRAIRKEVDIDSFGFLVNPENTNKIYEIISGYLKNTELYYQHCGNARRIAVEKYNWNLIENRFFKFLSIE